ncbi:PstS family phosphate ABC transporter substrate-binding protein [Terrimonas rubra]|uniref:PstS family phosphate ABC transporter substrate-binding protein n=1 Tax=Terrimonas rubra TaxID=1035890 RepID=A0ABW6A3I4_9BACT
MKQGLLKNIVAFSLAATLLAACGNDGKKTKQGNSTPFEGVTTISVDETFKPVIDAQVQVYESNRPGTKINVQYKPEVDSWNDLWIDSIPLIISTRRISESERKFIADSLKVAVRQEVVARDAIAVIVHPDAPDFAFTMEEVKQILTGNYSKKLTPVFDGVKATGTVRYLVDSVLKGAKLSPDAMAARTSDSVINFIASNPSAVGFIGVSWVGNQDDSLQQSFLKKIKVAYIESTDSAGKYVLPMPANVYRGKYPMVRDLVYILKEPYQGLATGFAVFLKDEIGQLIFKRAYLAPMLRDFSIRKMALKEGPVE